MSFDCTRLCIRQTQGQIPLGVFTENKSVNHNVRYIVVNIIRLTDFMRIAHMT